MGGGNILQVGFSNGHGRPHKNPHRATCAAYAAFSGKLSQICAFCETTPASCPPAEVPAITILTGFVWTSTNDCKLLTICWNASHPSLIGTGYKYFGPSLYSTLTIMTLPSKAMIRHDTSFLRVSGSPLTFGLKYLWSGLTVFGLKRTYHKCTRVGKHANRVWCFNLLALVDSERNRIDLR